MPQWGPPQTAEWVAAHAPPSPRALWVREPVPPPVPWNPYGDPFIPALSGIMTSMADGSVTVIPSQGSPYAGDDAVFINTAFQYTDKVRLIGSTYSTLSPIVFPANPGAKLCGPVGATQGGAGSPGVAAIIRPHTGWAAGGGPTAVIQAGTAVVQSIQDLWVDGTNIVTAGIDGIQVTGSGGTGNGGSVFRCGVNNMTGLGINVIAGLGFLGRDCIIQNCVGGGYYCGATDCLHDNIHAQNNQAVQIQLNSGDNRAVGCRADGGGTTGSTHGFVLNAFNGTGALGLGCILAECSTGGNLQNGVRCQGGGTNVYGPYKLEGCVFTQDGGGGTFAAVECIGRVAVSMSNCDVSTDAAGAHPAYCLQTDKNSGSNAVPDIVSVTGGLWQAATGFINDAGPATAHQIAGTMGFLGAQNGTTGTTAYAAVPW
jgi:hypothetical protein